VLCVLELSAMTVAKATQLHVQEGAMPTSHMFCSSVNAFSYRCCENFAITIPEAT
jgi:hypothetical protein